MINHVNALHRISRQLEDIDPVMAYDLSKNVNRLFASRTFILELNGLNKRLSHPADQIELTENRAGGWDWTHTNVDGHGTRDMTGWRLQPSEVIKMIDSQIAPGPATNEIREMLQESTSEGVPRGAEMGGGSTVIDTPSAVESGGLSKGIPRDPSRYESIWDVATQKLLKKAINIAHSDPSCRSKIIPVLRKFFDKAQSK